MDINELIDVVSTVRNTVSMRVKHGEGQVRVSEQDARQYVQFKNDAIRILPQKYHPNLPFNGKSADTVASIQDQNVTYGELFQAYATMAQLLDGYRNLLPVEEKA